LIEDDIEMNWECNDTVREARAGGVILEEEPKAAGAIGKIVLF
jgi:hypothetical protein